MKKRFISFFAAFSLLINVVAPMVYAENIKVTEDEQIYAKSTNIPKMEQMYSEDTNVTESGEAYTAENDEYSTNENKSDAEFADNSVIVVMKPENNASTYSLNSFASVPKNPFAGLGVSSVKSITTLDSDEITLFGGSSEREMLVLTLDEPSEDNVLSIVDELNEMDMVDYAQPNYMYKLTNTPDDEHYIAEKQYSLGIVSAEEVWGLDIDCSDVTVAVIDSGMMMTHEDLAENLWTNPNEIEGNGIDDDGNGYIDDIHGWDFVNEDDDPTDDNGHGTHVSGIVSAVTNNGTGVSSLARNAKIVPLKAGTSSGSLYSSDLCQAYAYIRDKGFDVANCSYGGYGYDTAAAELIKSCSDTLFICAAGNDCNNNDTTPQYPASYESDNVMSILATGFNDTQEYYSNHGDDTVDIGAPGEAIFSTGYQSENSYVYMSGTSMASPLVASAAAVVKAQYPDLSPSEVFSAIVCSVDKLDSLNGDVYSGGRLNAYNALNYAQMLTAPLADEMGATSEIIASGAYNDSVSWTLDGYGVLRIVGSGRVTSNINQWYEYREQIKSVEIGFGVNYIDGYAFYNCTNLENITISPTVMTIINGSFKGCSESLIIKGYNDSRAESYANEAGFTFESLGEMPDEIILSGNYSDTLSWTLSSYGTLKIEGTGEITNNKEHWYDYRNYVKKAELSDGITKIGEDAFRECEKMESVNIPDTVTAIDGWGFYHCSSLTSVEIPDGVTVIGDSSFNGCSKLTSIEIPEGVTELGTWAFMYCYALESVKLPNSLVTIGQSAFCDCSKLTSIEIPENVNLIYHFAFNGCSNLVSINIPDGVTTISYATFRYCYNLTNINIPDNVTIIGDEAFYGCNKFKTIDIPNGATTIGEDSFKYCYNLKSITIPDTVETIGENAFLGCSNDLAIIGYSGSVAETYAKENNITFVPIILSGSYSDTLSWTLDSQGLLTIKGTGEITDNRNQDWYDYVSSVKTVVISDGVTAIGNYGFYNCSNLTEITIPNTVLSIAANAFNGHSSELLIKGYTDSSAETYANENNIDFISIGDSEGAFIASGKYSDDLKWILYKDGVLKITGTGEITNISNQDWNSYSNLVRKIEISDGVTSIGDYAFYWCTNLTEIDIPESVTTIGTYAFYNTGLKNITIPEGVISIDNYAFCSNPYLENITLPDTLTTIGAGVFSSNSMLQSITIPVNVNSIGGGIFSNCNNLNISVDENNAYYSSVDGVLFNKDKTILVAYAKDAIQPEYVIPDGVITIGTSAFYGNQYLTSVVIPNSVTTIGTYAFQYCYMLENVTMPDSIVAINSYAFYNCKVLPSIEIPASVTYIGSSVFEQCQKLNIMVDENNANYSSVDGVLFNKDKTKLLCYAKDLIQPEYVIPDGVTTIGSDAFSNCSFLTNVTIPNGVTTIGSAAFWNCSKLKNINIPNSVYSLGDNSFGGCSALESITIPYTVISISDKAFRYHSNSLVIRGYTGSAAETFAINNNITFESIGEMPHEIMLSGKYSDTLTWTLNTQGVLRIRGTGEITSNSAQTWYNYRTYVKKVIISNGVTSIGSNAFYWCSALTDIRIPNSVESIGQWAFYNCRALESIEIPEAVTSIGRYAFYNCSSLEDFTVFSKTATFDSDCFRNHSDALIISGHAGSTSEEFANANNIPFNVLPERGVEMEIVYGTEFSLEADVSMDMSEIALQSEPALDQVAFYVDDKLLGIADVEYTDDSHTEGTAILTVIADKEHFEIGNNSIRTVYGGSINLNGSENDNANVVMIQRPITATVNGANKVYDGNTDIDVTLELADVVEGDDITATASATLPASDVGIYSNATLSNIMLSGEDAEYYTIATNEIDCDIEIIPKDIADNDIIVDDIYDCVFTGEAIKPDVAITYAEMTLTADDYDLSYNNNINSGVATVTISGKGNYTGTRTANFNILKAGSVVVTTIVYGNNLRLTASVSDGVETVEFYSGATLLGVAEVNDETDTAKLVVKMSKDNFVIGENTITAVCDGEVVLNNSANHEITVKLVAKNISLVKAAKISDYEYTGGSIEPKVVLMDGSTELTADDYDVAYSNNTEVGTATITVTGKEYYTGEKIITFNILEEGLEVLSGLDDIMMVHNNDGILSIKAKDNAQLPEIMLYTAIYDSNNELVDIFIAENQIDEDKNISIILPQLEPEDGQRIVYMLWTKDLVKPVVNL